MSKMTMSSEAQYQYADWNLTKLKGVIEALYYQDTITEALKNVMFGTLTTVWGFARNAANDLGYKNGKDIPVGDD